MVSKKPFMNQEILYNNRNYERKLCTVSAYIKSFLSIIEIDNKICHICSIWNTPIELVSDKLIMSLNGLHTANSPRKFDRPKFTILTKDTIVLDVIFQNYFKESLFEDVICESFHQVFMNQ